MDIYDKKNYESGSPNAIRLEKCIRQVGAWPEDPHKADKLLRRQLTILRNGEMAGYKATTLLINRIDDETVRLGYWRNRAPKLCQDMGLFDWASGDLSIEEIKERLFNVGIGYGIIDEDFEIVRENARKKIQQLKERKERREKESYKLHKKENLLKLKYQTLLRRIGEEQDILLTFHCYSLNPVLISIAWHVYNHNFQTSDLQFSLSGEFGEKDYPRSYESVVGNIIRLVPLGKSLIQALEKTGNHVLMADGDLHVMCGPRPLRHSIFLGPMEEKPEVLVLEGEDVGLAEKLNDKAKELGLQIFTPRYRH